MRAPHSQRFLRQLTASALAGLGIAALTFLVLSPSGSSEGTADPATPVAAGPAAPAAVPPTPVIQLVSATAPAAAGALEADLLDALPPAPESPLVVTQGALGKGDSLGRSMRRRGVPARTVHMLTRKLGTRFDFRRAQPGHAWELVQDASGETLSFLYRTSELEGFEVLREGDGYAVSEVEVELEPQLAHIAGIVSVTPYEAITALGGDRQVANDFTDIFAWDIDFSRAVRPGDEFKVLYERLYRRDGDGNPVYVRPGKILAARYRGAAGDHTAVYFESEAGRGGYYRADGSAVERQFLQAPLRYTRITSSYSPARRHPILKVTRPHYGIDFAAPAGTQLWSVADGEVIYRGWAGGFGNLVKIRHANGYVSYYSHLSRFARGLRVGDHVSQKQVIGYVGSTGLATGPHVCFRITKDGKYVNPATARLRRPVARPLADELRPTFEGVRDRLLASLDAGPLLETDEAL